jgi:hypothetical protein
MLFGKALINVPDESEAVRRLGDGADVALNPGEKAQLCRRVKRIGIPKRIVGIDEYQAHPG